MIPHLVIGAFAYNRLQVRPPRAGGEVSFFESSTRPQPIPLRLLLNRPNGSRINF